MNKIVLTGGGTAGHCIPNVAILPLLKKHFDGIYYIGTENGIEKKIIEKEKIPYYSVPCAKLRRDFSLKNLGIPFKVFSGIINAKKILKTLKPDLVFSKGGYVSVPVVYAAYMLKIPVISHESDITPGLANRITARYCKAVLTSFPDTAKRIKNGIYVGSPIRNELLKKSEKNYEMFGFTGEKPVLLIMGGSSGAKAINDVIFSSLSELLRKFDIIHICGKGNVFIQKKDGYFPVEYLDDMKSAFTIADICVSRAGSNSAFELMALKIPTLFIPLPKNASRGDQILNAEFFYNKNLAKVLYQEDLTKTTFVKAVYDLFYNKDKLKRKLNESEFSAANAKIVDQLLNYSVKDQRS